MSDTHLKNQNNTPKSVIELIATFNAIQHVMHYLKHGEMLFPHYTELLALDLKQKNEKARICIELIQRNPPSISETCISKQIYEATNSFLLSKACQDT